MFKALLKKQFLELNKGFFTGRNGKRRSLPGSIAILLLFGYVAVSFIVMFYAIAMTVSPLITAGYGWLYFSMMGLFTIFIGLFGSVFSTYSMLYNSGDNEFLLSMPIPPSVILTVRMLIVYLLSLLYSAFIWIPAVVRYFITVKTPSTASVVCSLLLLLIISLFVNVFCCFFGWLVALCAGRLRNRSVAVVLLTLVFLGLYYYVFFRIRDILGKIIEQPDKVSAFFKAWAYPLTQLGYGAEGNIGAFLIFTGITAALFALCCYILSKSFIRIATRSGPVKKAEYHASKIKASTVGKALLRKEAKMYVSSPTYLLNTGLGKIVLTGAAVAAVIKKAEVTENIRRLEAVGLKGIMPVMAVVAAIMILSMDNVSAPSVSLEGKYFYILQSFPVEPYEIIRAKERFHLYLNMIPALIFTGTLGYIIGAEMQTVVLMCACVLVYVSFSANAGLMLNILRPNLHWTKEAVPVKQSFPIAAAMFGGWAIALAAAAVYYLLRNTVSQDAYLSALTLILTLALTAIRKWLRGKGSEILRYLQ